MDSPNRNPRVERTRRHQRHREQVMRANNGVCHICETGGADAIDHIVPVAWGGSDDPRNLAPAHTSCNSKKRDTAPDSWTYKFPEMWLPGYGPRSEEGRFDLEAFEAEIAAQAAELERREEEQRLWLEKFEHDNLMREYKARREVCRKASTDCTTSSILAFVLVAALIIIMVVSIRSTDWETSNSTGITTFWIYVLVAGALALFVKGVRYSWDAKKYRSLFDMKPEELVAAKLPGKRQG